MGQRVKNIDTQIPVKYLELGYMGERTNFGTPIPHGPC